MKKIFILTITAVFLSMPLVYAQAERILQVKHGMHQKSVEEIFGQPVKREKLKKGFWPIPKEKALYKIDEEDYMILSFFSGRVKGITILSGTDYEQALSVYNN